MLTAEGIGGGVAGDDAVAEMAVVVVTGEEAERAAPRWMNPKIGGGGLLLVVEGTP